MQGTPRRQAVGWERLSRAWGLCSTTRRLPLDSGLPEQSDDQGERSSSVSSGKDQLAFFPSHALEQICSLSLSPHMHATQIGAVIPGLWCVCMSLSVPAITGHPVDHYMCVLPLTQPAGPLTFSRASSLQDPEAKRVLALQLQVGNVHRLVARIHEWASKYSKVTPDPYHQEIKHTYAHLVCRVCLFLIKIYQTLQRFPQKPVCR